MMCSTCRVAVKPSTMEVGGASSCTRSQVRRVTPAPRPCRKPASSTTRRLTREQQRLGLVDRRRQFDLPVITLGRDEQRPRIGQRSSRAIDLVEQGLAEAARDAVARQRQQLADGAHADARHSVSSAGLGALEQRDRQAAPVPARRNRARHLSIAMPRPARAKRLAAPAVGAVATTPEKPSVSQARVDRARAAYSRPPK